MAQIPAHAASHLATSNEFIDMVGGRFELVARMGNSEDDTVLFRTQLPPGQVVPLHSHADPECFYVLSGRLDLLLLGRAPHWRALPAGRTALVAGGIRHAVRNPSDEPADVVVTTNNRFARFCREAGRPARPDTAFAPPGRDDIERLLQTAKAFGYWMSSPEEHAALTRCS